MESFSFWHWVIFALSIGFTWHWLTSKKSPTGIQRTSVKNFVPTVQSITPKSESSTLKLKGTGSFDITVAGVQHRRAALEKGFRAKLKEAREDIENPGLNESETIEATLTLAYEDNNPHDSNAVAVMLRGVRIGYLPRGVASLFRGYIDRENAHSVKYQCKAEVELPIHPEGEWEIAIDLPYLKD